MGSKLEMQLDKILIHAKNAHGFVEGTDVRAFHGDLIRRSAVVGQMIALGLATRSLPDQAKAKLPEVPWRRLEEMADSLVRDYGNVDPSVIWETVTLVIPHVIRTLTSFLGRNPESLDKNV